MTSENQNPSRCCKAITESNGSFSYTPNSSLLLCRMRYVGKIDNYKFKLRTRLNIAKIKSSMQYSNILDKTNIINMSSENMTMNWILSQNTYWARAARKTNHADGMKMVLLTDCSNWRCRWRFAAQPTWTKDEPWRRSWAVALGTSQKLDSSYPGAQERTVQATKAVQEWGER